MKQLRDLPNLEGFTFIGVDKEGNKHPCQVRKDSVGCHSVYNIENGKPFFMQLSGWERTKT